jgi:hypothetical protein
MGVGLGADGVGMLRLSFPGERAELVLDTAGSLGIVISSGCRFLVEPFWESKARPAGSCGGGGSGAVGDLGFPFPLEDPRLGLQDWLSLGFSLDAFFESFFFLASSVGLLDSSR